MFQMSGVLLVRRVQIITEEPINSTTQNKIMKKTQQIYDISITNLALFILISLLAFL